MNYKIVIERTCTCGADPIAERRAVMACDFLTEEKAVSDLGGSLDKNERIVAVFEGSLRTFYPLVNADSRWEEADRAATKMESKG